MTGIIYKITNKINNKIYIGQTIQNLKDRWYRHCGNTGSSAELGMVIKKAIHKYGKDNFIIEELERCNQSLLNEREIYWISYYDSYNHGYNSTLGGQNGAKLPKLLNEANNIINLYNQGFSLSKISRKYNVDHATIKHILLINNIKLRSTKTYKLSQIDRINLMEDFNNGMSRKEIMSKYHISKSYLSQMINGRRRI